MTGVGAKNMNPEPALGRAMSQSRANATRSINGSGQQPPVPTSYGNGPATELVIGDQAYAVDPNHDPQTTRSQPSSADSNVGREDDPLARQMKELRNGSVRRNSIMQNNNDQSHARKDSAVLSPPESSNSRKDYRNSAEMVVGAYPIASSRPVSPSQPTAALMKPSQNPAATGLSVEGVLADYPQKLPGERAAHSRSNSRQSYTGEAGSQNRATERPVSREGFAGIGSQGRSPDTICFIFLSGLVDIRFLGVFRFELLFDGSLIIFLEMGLSSEERSTLCFELRFNLGGQRLVIRRLFVGF